MDKEIQAFRKKEVMNLEEMKNNVRKLSQITSSLEAAVNELEVRDTKPSPQCENRRHMVMIRGSGKAEQIVFISKELQKGFPFFLKVMFAGK